MHALHPQLLYIPPLHPVLLCIPALHPLLLCTPGLCPLLLCIPAQCPILLCVPALCLLLLCTPGLHPLLLCTPGLCWSVALSTFPTTLTRTSSLKMNGFNTYRFHLNVSSELNVALLKNHPWSLARKSVFDQAQ